MHSSRHDGRKRPFTGGKEDKSELLSGPLWAVGRQFQLGKGLSHTHLPRCPAASCASPFTSTARELGKQKVGKGHGLTPQVPEHPASVPWPVARSQNWVKLLLTSILDVLNVKEIWININLLSKFKVSTPAQSDGKENLSLEISTFWWYICMLKVRVQRQFEKIKEPSKGKLSPFHVFTDDGNIYYLRVCII